MRGANVLTWVAVLAWFALSMIGASLLQGVASQGVPGYPNSGQIQFLVVYPLLVAATLIGCAWLCNRGEGRPALLGCLSGTAMLAFFPYFLGFGGGV
jgi:hypothetical protein